MNERLPLEVENMSYGFRDPVFKDVSFSILPGEFVTVVVSPGAPKSALFDCLLGNLKPTTGKIQFWGQENRGYQRESIQQKVGWVLSKKEAYAPWIRVSEYLLAASRLFKTWNPKLSQQLVDKLGLNLNLRMSDLTPVDATKLSLVKALAFEPKLLVLDDVLATLAPDQQNLVLETLLEQFAKGKMAVLKISSSSNTTAKLSNKVIVISRPGASPGLDAAL